MFYRPEAVHLGDLLRIWVRHSARFQFASLGFSRVDDRTRDPARAAELYGIRCCTLSRGEPLPGCLRPYKEKRTLPRPDANVPQIARVTAHGSGEPPLWSRQLRSGILTGFPFAHSGDRFRREQVPTFRTAFAYDLGSADPCPTAVHMEPFSTSVFRGLVGIFATTTEICTRGGSSRARARTFDAHRGDPPTRRSIVERELPAPTAEHRLVATAPSIFRAGRFGR